MPPKKERDYLIDVAKGHKYRNQSEEYQKSYLQWRTDPKNPFGYTFVHDTRVHTYVDGEGYLEESPVSSERQALNNCYRVMGASLLIMVAVAFVRYIVMLLAFNVPYAGRSYYTDFSIGNSGLPDHVAYTLLVLNLLEYILPIAFLKASTRMPSKIAVPLKRSKNISAVSSVTMMLVILTIGRSYNNLVSYLLSQISIDIPCYDYIRPSSPLAFVICSIGQHVILGILMEIIFRGYFLQMLRQFGDSFAVIVTAIGSSLLLYDITQAGYMFCVSIFVGIVTIRSGSIKNACIMRIIARYLNYILTFITDLVDEYWGRIIDLSVSGLLLFLAVLVYMRINARRRWSFEVSSAGTSMTLSEKFRMLAVSPWAWIWIISALAMSVLLMRIS